MNLDDISAAIERADEASRLGDIEYTESVWWRATEADENLFSLIYSIDLKISFISV